MKKNTPQNPLGRKITSNILGKGNFIYSSLKGNRTTEPNPPNSIPKGFARFFCYHVYPVPGLDTEEQAHQAHQLSFSRVRAELQNEITETPGGGERRGGVWGLGKRWCTGLEGKVWKEFNLMIARFKSSTAKKPLALRFTIYTLTMKRCEKSMAS